MLLVVSPQKIAFGLICLVALLVVGAASAECVHAVADSWEHRGVATLADKLRLDGELTIPAWYSSCAILLCGVTLALIAWAGHRTRSAYFKHWAGLAVIFVLMSIDEMTAIHETLIVPFRRHLGVSGIFWYGWVIPAIVLLIAFGVAYRRFVFLHLDRSTRRRFLLAGAIYVGAALGLEMVEGPIDQHLGDFSPWALLAVNVEETLEMIGIIIFEFALLRYLAEQVGQVLVVFQDIGQDDAVRVRRAPKAAVAVSPIGTIDPNELITTTPR